MDKLRHKIKSINKYNLEYYNSLLDIVDRYIEEKPDIPIETCKAIIEGISKLILHVLNQEPLGALNTKNLQDLFKEALWALQHKGAALDQDFIRNIGTVVRCLGETRNNHGDISHGRASTKDQINDAHFSDMIAGLTENLGIYLLTKFDEISDAPVRYSDNAEFNEYLEEQHPLDGLVLYSKALFEQEPETYEVLLGDYIIENNPEE